MYDELTKVDIKKMKDELEYRIGTVRPKILEEVKFTRSFGDLSENAEYHAAKRERGKNESRIRYLRNMIKTARIIEPESREDEVGLFDTVEYYVEEDDAVEKVRIVTSLRQNSLERLISRESPMGKALMGAKKGDRVCVKVSDEYGYYIVIREIVKGNDDARLEIRKFLLKKSEFFAIINKIKIRRKVYGKGFFTCTHAKSRKNGCGGGKAVLQQLGY